MAAAINWGRVRRYASFGVIDGSCSHVWFNMLDQAIPDTTVLAVVEKIIVDFLVFTPGWCAVFLVYMALSEGAGKMARPAPSIPICFDFEFQANYPH